MLSIHSRRDVISVSDKLYGCCEGGFESGNVSMMSSYGAVVSPIVTTWPGGVFSWGIWISMLSSTMCLTAVCVTLSKSDAYLRWVHDYPIIRQERWRTFPWRCSALPWEWVRPRSYRARTSHRGSRCYICALHGSATQFGHLVEAPLLC